MNVLKKLLEKVRPPTCGPTLQVLPGRAEMLVTYPASPPPAIYRQSTATVEATIAALGQVRAEMLPAVRERWPRGEKTFCFRNPTWSIETDQLAGDVLLHVRDEGFGWLHYIFTKAEAAKLGLQLAAFAAAPAPATLGSA